MEECKQYDCNIYGAFECPKTRILDRDDDYNCPGAVSCRTCYWMGLDGKTRFCTAGDHYCYFENKSGWEPKVG